MNDLKTLLYAVAHCNMSEKDIDKICNSAIDRIKQLEARVKELEDKLELAESLIDDNSYSYYIYESSKAGE